MIWNSYYGSYRTRIFSDIFSTEEEFEEFYKDCGIPHKVDGDISTIYYLLLSKYANSPIASSDENRFKLNVMSLIFQYGPTWSKRIAIQDALKVDANSLAEYAEGSRATHNHAFNPETAPSTTDAEELAYINEQNVSKFKRGKLDVYANLMALLATDVTEQFLSKFKSLFTTFGPERPLFYISKVEEEEDDE